MYIGHTAVIDGKAKAIFQASEPSYSVFDDPLNIESFGFVKEFLFNENLADFSFGIFVPNDRAFKELFNRDVSVLIRDQDKQKILVTRGIHRTNS